MLTRIAAVAMMALVTSGGASAQTRDLACSPENRAVKASREFVENYSAAQAALSAKRYQDALIRADAATPYAADAYQLQVLLQIKSVSYFGLGDKANL